MIEVFKLLEGVENVDYNQFLTSAITCYALRGHDRKLVKTRSRLDIESSFSANEWSTPGIVYRPLLYKHHLRTCLRMHMTKYLARGMDA